MVATSVIPAPIQRPSPSDHRVGFSTWFTRLRLGSLALRPALLLLGNSRPRVTTTPLPHATGAHGQLPGRDFNPLDLLLLLRTVKTHLALYDQTRELERMVELRTRELEITRRQIICQLGRASEFRDNETGNHIIRVSHYSRLIARAAGMGEASAEILFSAAPMHDVGKIGIPDHVLLKPGPLDEEEWAIIRKHPEMGAGIIDEHQDDLLKMARIVALTHHEKWDGSGYPHGLKGADIPLAGRIVAIADVFDALTSNRPYKDSWAFEEAARSIIECAGTHFDPDLVAAFKSMLPEIREINKKYAEENRMQPGMELTESSVGA